MGEEVPQKSIFGEDLFGEMVEQAGGKLQKDFIVPPFSVLDARQGYWQERKRAWLALGIQSELGRGDNILGHFDQSINIDFYSQKRALEKELGYEITTDEARQILEERGTIRVVSGQASEKSKAFKNQGRLTALQKTGHSRAKVFGTEGNISEQTGTSIFDPVLCELAYTWFCPPGGTVLDPFAGGSVRGIVAAFLGYKYIGIDLSEAQVEANREQAGRIVPDNLPRWIVGDSRNLRDLVDRRVDFLFTCPPYYDLEVYSEDARDLSLADDYREFSDAHRDIVWQAVDLLKPNRFACWVIGDIRDSEGFYRALPFHTMLTFVGAGLRLYNDAILLTAVGSLPVRIRKQFRSGRKLGKTHQNVLVFVKGDSKKAAEGCNE